MNAGLSDLFFNHDHDNYNALPWGAPKAAITDEMIITAIRADALEFCLQIEAAFDETADVEALVEDFIKRR